MEVAERSQSSQDEKEGDDDVVGRMEIDDASDMTEVAGILLRLHVTPPPHPNTFGFDALKLWKTSLPPSVLLMLIMFEEDVQRDGMRSRAQMVEHNVQRQAQ